MKKVFDKIYLKLSDCDGMCDHCKLKLKTVCERNKIDCEN